MLYLLIFVEICLVLFKSLDVSVFWGAFCCFYRCMARHWGGLGGHTQVGSVHKLKNHQNELNRNSGKSTVQKTAQTITHKGLNVFPIIVKHANLKQQMDFRECFLEAFSSSSVRERKRFRRPKSSDFLVVLDFVGAFLSNGRRGAQTKQDPTET